MVCRVCRGSGFLLRDVCPLCDGEEVALGIESSGQMRRDEPKKTRFGLSLRASCLCSTCDREETQSEQMLAELSKPQAAFWRHRWPIKKPGSRWTLSGHSRALVRSGFVIEELQVFLDAGVGWKNPNPMPSVICVTHTHIDHCNALPMLLRTAASPSILAPSNHLAALKEMTDMTWSVKFQNWDPSLRARAAVRGSERWKCSVEDQGEVVHVANRGAHRRWVPVQSGDCLTIPHKGGWGLKIVRCFHTIEDVGFVLCEIFSKRQGVNAEAEAALQDVNKKIESFKQAGDKKEAGIYGRRIGDMMKAGQLCEVKTHVPRVAYLCDTTAQVFGPCAECRRGDPCSFASAGPYTPPCGPIAELDEQAELIFQCSTIIVECSFVSIGMEVAEAEQQAISRGHLAWSQLRPIVEGHPDIEFILVHFSERYTDEELRIFFSSASSRRGPLHNILLWLDEGLCRGGEHSADNFQDCKSTSH